MEKIAMGIDIGGSHITCQLFGLNTNKLIAGSKVRNSVDGNGSKESILESWVKAIKQTTSQKDLNNLTGIGFAMPGPFDYKNGVAWFDKNVDKFQKLYGVDVKAELLQRLDLPNDFPIRFLNDASSFAVGDQKNPDEGYRSRLNKETEEAPIGYYKAELTDYDITAELTATTRGGFQRYTFPNEKEGSRILLDLQNPAEYSYKLEEVFIEKVNDNRVEGCSKQLSPNTWSGGISQEYIVHFVAEFDQPIKNYGVWTEDSIQETVIWNRT